MAGQAARSAAPERATPRRKRPRPSGPTPEELAGRAAELRKAAAELPVSAARQGIIDIVRKHGALVLIGETGSGKTTQVPQFVLDALGDSCRCVAITQPRRLAAVTVAKRVAEEQGVELGGRVGYAVRFDDKSSRGTRIKYMTDGLLIRELLTDRTIPHYGAVILDEAHERSVNTDVLFGLLKRLRRESRPDLKVIVMSATLNADLFSKFWDNCPIGYVKGRAHPVTTYYASEPQADVVDACVTAALQVHLDHPKTPGDVLVFMTGQDAIEDAARILEERAQLLAPGRGILIVPLYAGLPWEKQARAFVPPPEGMRKIILSTNVAETSLTIPNVRFVVDCGLVKEKRYNPRTGMDSLTEVAVSRAQAQQRCGRAGREFPGECYRLYTEEVFQGLQPSTEAEIRRVNLASVVLQLKRMGVDPLHFDFIEAPAKPHLVAALHLLLVLGALDNSGDITPLGREMSRYPLDPTHAKVLLAADATGVLHPCATILAMLAVENVMQTPSQRERDLADQRRQDFASPHGDHLTLLNAFREYQKAHKEGRSSRAAARRGGRQRRQSPVAGRRGRPCAARSQAGSSSTWHGGASNAKPT
eukprot:TRINITY_DN31979_c0_g1_i1.p1 TRINITY_DN31979_c0_g1~~TRINITY_DN31979_c0_g1_i1.p1  ORF type:complete len:590 (+),score=160.93 TRINITY_DN31979_c0_g1_i1:75-1844(+)